jgi:hypothetical protein
VHLEIGNCANREIKCPIVCFVPDREPDFLIDSHVKLDILVDTQEPLNTSHHKIAFKYDDDTVSLVIEQTSPHWTCQSPTTPIPLLGTHPQLLNMNATRSRMTYLDSITMGLRSRFLNKNHP